MPTLLIMLLFFLLLSPSAPEAAVSARPLPGIDRYHRQYVTLKPAHQRDHRIFRGFGGAGRDVRGCKPRGFRPPPSAPSRYVNYNTLGSAMCGTRGHHTP
ncbi:hypothetical protein Cni_G14557 [Canna indica]|uniref:Secreted protein n=1 Tax=Canna indica TaxID=4628 RepID=A0AAQ3QAS2_9LILI|nr:hypothetical protein Cni_G14557 [Canna indica]